MQCGPDLRVAKAQGTVPTIGAGSIHVQPLDGLIPLSHTGQRCSECGAERRLNWDDERLIPKKKSAAQT